MSETVELTVNGRRTVLPTGATLADVVDSLGAPGGGCAVAVDDEVVPRADWVSHALRSGQRVEVLTAVQGG